MHAIFKTFCALGLAAILTPDARAADAVAIVIDTFNSPVYVTSAPGESTLLFVVEQTGKIQILQNEVTQSAPFLDLTSLISCCDERGVLSMAFAPNYARTHLFYVAFTNRKGDVEVDEFKRSLNPMVASRTSRRKLITVSHREAGNHNGGQLQFGPDGYLYISTGDGGEVFPRGKYARDLNKLLGKILRIDPAPSANLPYTIPADNPFVGTGHREEIFAYGLRNPWRFSFDRNRIIIADVGQGSFEEINFLPVDDAKGANFGWPQYEGNTIFDNSQPGPDPVTFPMYVYDHNSGGCAVIGGYVSHDPNISALNNRYLFGDLCAGDILSFIGDVAHQKAITVRTTGISSVNLTSFGVGPNKKTYFTRTNGKLLRIDPPPL